MPKKTIEPKRLTPQQQQLVTDNLRLAYNEAHSCRRKGWIRRLNPDEAESTAMMGLIDAAIRFDPDYVPEQTGKPIAFSTYAVISIRHALFDDEARAGVIRLRSELLRNLKKRDEGQPQRDTNECLDKVRCALNLQPLSYTSDDEQCVSVDHILVDKHSDRQERIRSGLKGAINELNWRDRQLLWHYYLAANNMTFEEIGKQRGITKERVRQLRNEAVKKMRPLVKEMESLL